MKLFKVVCLLIVLFVLSACGAEDEALPTAVQPASTPALPATNSLPPTNDITTDPQPETLDGTPALETPEIPPGTAAGDDFLPIDSILNEIDNEVCADAYETLDELEALIEAGEDVTELKTAVEELIAELENCPTPTP